MNIDNYFGELGNLTLEIAELLDSGNNNLSPDDIENIKSLYGQRRKVIENINSWIKTEKGIFYIKNNKKEWLEKVQPFIDVDKILLAKMENKLNVLSVKIRNLSKQKSLLVYMKENNDEY